MSALLQALTACLCGSTSDYEPDYISSYPNEKAALLSPDLRTAEDIASEVVHALLTAEKSGLQLQRELDGIVGAQGWTERIAEWILAKLEVVLREGSLLRPLLKEAYDKAYEAAMAIEGFVKEHPVFCTVIAIGVLVLVAPWVLEALGFAEVGVLEGSWAAAWQARYAGYVPKGSLFSFLQRLGMVWHL